MNSAIIHELVRSVLQKKSLQDCSLDELQKVAEEHPYFAIGQLLLAAKLNVVGDNNDKNYLQKLSLYIQDPLWLEQLLEQQGDMIIHPPSINKATEEPVPVELTKEHDTTTMPTPEAAVVADPIPTAQDNLIDPIVQDDTPAVQPERKADEPPTNNPTVLSGSDITFEPYHTVDYFASQGIRYKEEEQPKDKFGQQLKSFTEWLKTLKRLPVAEIPVTVDSRIEQKVEQMAEYSLADREVVTEAMAEVWLKQGNNEKAIATYNKLSLLNPSKSAYFAAKIEQLKRP